MLPGSQHRGRSNVVDGNRRIVPEPLEWNPPIHRVELVEAEAPDVVDVLLDQVRQLAARVTP